VDSREQPLDRLNGPGWKRPFFPLEAIWLDDGACASVSK